MLLYRVHLLAFFCRVHHSRRWVMHHTRKEKRYSDTLNLPRSKFPMKHSRQLELELEQNSNFHLQFEQLFEPSNPNISEQMKRWFILHDGPPYANGDAHFGHAVNRVSLLLCILTFYILYILNK